MENQKDSVEETLGHDVYPRNNTETEHRSVVEPKIPTTINARREEEKVTHSFRENTTRENKGILKETSATGSYFEGVGDITEGEDKSPRESKEDAMMTRQVTSADDTHRMLDDSKQQIRSPRKIGARPHQRPFCHIIGKREKRRSELEKMEGNLRQRLDMLECSMPAVMAWNICRITQGASACRVKHILEKQFEAAGKLPARSTPSSHYDCRVREVEAERKLALKKVEEARALWAEKVKALEERRRELEEAKRVQEEQKNTMKRLNEEIEALREAMEKAEAEEDESCQHGECGEKQCKQRWLARMSSVTSIHSEDIECLDKLQKLVEEELIIKKDITELERREDAYMKMLQRADELWSKVEGDAVSSTNALQEQLDTKTAANQQLADRVCELEDALEKCRTRMAACRTELEKFLSIEKLEAAIGRDDDVADVTDRAVAVKAKVTHRPIGRLDDVATVKDDEVLVKVEAVDEEISAVIATVDADAAVTLLVDDKYVSVKPESADLVVDRQVDLVAVEEKESIVRIEDFDYEQQRFEEIKEYLAQLGSLEELYEDDGEPCPPDFVCNDVVTSPNGMTDEELIAMGVEPTEAAERIRKLAASKEERKREETEKIADEIERKAVEKMEGRAADGRLITPLEMKRFDAEQDVVIKRDELLSWIDKIDTIREKIAKYPELRAVKREADILAEQIGAHVGVKPKEVTVDKIEETKLDEDKIKYMPEVSAELPKIDLIEKTQVVDIKLKDKMVVPEEESKIPLIPTPPSEAEVDLIKKEIIPVEPSIETPQIKKIEVDDDTMKPVDEGKLITEKVEEITPEHAEKIEVQIKSEVEEPLELITHLEDAPVEADLKDEITTELFKPVEPSKPIPVEPPEIERMEVDDDTIKPIDEELLIVQEVKPKEEVIPEYAETTEIETQDLPTKEMIERGAELRAEIIETEEAPSVTIKRETEPTDVEEIVPVVDMKEVEKLTIDEIAPRVDLTEVEQPKPGELPIVTEAPITEVEETIEPPVLEIDITKVKDQEIEEAPERVFMPPVVPREEAEETLPLIKEKEAEAPTLLKMRIETAQEEAILQGKFLVFEAFKVEEKILIVKAKPSKATEALAMPVESPAKPHFVLDQRTKFEEQKLLHIIPEATKPLSTIMSASSVEESAPEIAITTRTGIVEAELITEARHAEHREPSAQIISKYFKTSELEANVEITGARPEITGRKIPWRKRLKDQSTVTTTSPGSQTDKSSHVSYDRVERERSRLTTDELLRSIKIVTGLARGDTEREIRTINYGIRTPDDETATKAACNCCLCGNAPSLSSSSMMSRLPIQPQVDAKATTPLAAAFKRAFIPPKTDHVIPYDRLCQDCKAKIQSKITRDRYRIEQVVDKITQAREKHTSSLSTGTSCCVVVRERTVEKRDQSCLAKMSKRKAEVAEQKKKRDLPAFSEQMEKTDVKPLTPSCTCFQLEKPSAGPMRKGNCYCAD